MNRVCLAIVSSALAFLEGAETPAPPSVEASTPVTDQAAPQDFIIPLASDFQLGYVVNAGQYLRRQNGGSGTDNHFIEQGLWLGYVHAVSDPASVMSGYPDWRVEVGVLAAKGDVANPNGSHGTLQTVMLDLGLGPSWTIADNGANRQEWGITAFTGLGLSRYTNVYTSQNGGIGGTTTVESSGYPLEFGVKAQVLWYWQSGWGAAVQAGFVQRIDRLNGDSTTRWDDGSVNHRGYASDDRLTGVRFGLSMAKRF